MAMGRPKTKVVFSCHGTHAQDSSASFCTRCSYEAFGAGAAALDARSRELRQQLQEKQAEAAEYKVWGPKRSALAVVAFVGVQMMHANDKAFFVLIFNMCAWAWAAKLVIIFLVHRFASGIMAGRSPQAPGIEAASPGAGGRGDR